MAGGGATALLRFSRIAWMVGYGELVPSSRLFSVYRDSVRDPDAMRRYCAPSPEPSHHTATPAAGRSLLTDESLMPVM